MIQAASHRRYPLPNATEPSLRLRRRAVRLFWATALSLSALTGRADDGAPVSSDLDAAESASVLAITSESESLQPMLQESFAHESTANATSVPQASTPEPSAPELSAPEMNVRVEDALEQRGTISFRQTSIQEVVLLLSDLWNVNIVAGQQVTGNVTGTFNDAALRDVLSAILGASGYGYTLSGNSLVVLPAEQVGTVGPEFQSETMPIPPSMQDDVPSLIEAAQLLLSERGRIRAIGSTTVLVIDNADGIARVRDMLRQFGGGQLVASSSGPPAADMTGNPSSAMPASVAAFGARPQIAYFTPQYTEASEMVDALTDALGEDAVVAVYEAENRLIVKGNPAMLELAHEAVNQLDQPRSQVRITTMIYDVDLEELERLGVNWGRGLRTEDALEGTAFADLTGRVAEAFSYSTLGTEGVSQLGIRTITNAFDTTLLLEALDTSSEAKLLADPSITCADRKPASIKIVEKIPVIAINPVEGSNVVVAQVEFEDAGIILNVVPRVGRDGTIEMNVQPEYSVVTGFTGTEGNRYPIIDSRTAETTVRVGDGHMFVLGGLRQKTVTETISGVPYLRDMRFIGKLFRNHDTQVRESELIVFIRPEVITPFDCGRPRQRVAAKTSSYELDAIAHATLCPQLPCCKDPNCPNHHPRPRVNHGSHSLRMFGDVGITPTFLSGCEGEGECNVTSVNDISPTLEFVPSPDFAEPTPDPNAIMLHQSMEGNIR